MKNQDPGVEPEPFAQKNKKKKIIPTLQIALTIFGLLYLLYIIDFNMNDNYDPYKSENIVINLSFVLFLIGYYIAWKNEGVAGIIFVFWWAVMWYLASIAEHDKGGGIVFGLPLIILGVLFIISWYRKKGKGTSASVSEP